MHGGNCRLDHSDLLCFRLYMLILVRHLGYTSLSKESVVDIYKLENLRLRILQYFLNSPVRNWTEGTRGMIDIYG